MNTPNNIDLIRDDNNYVLKQIDINKYVFTSDTRNLNIKNIFSDQYFKLQNKQIQEYYNAGYLTDQNSTINTTIHKNNAKNIIENLQKKYSNSIVESTSVVLNSINKIKQNVIVPLHTQIKEKYYNFDKEIKNNVYENVIFNSKKYSFDNINSTINSINNNIFNRNEITNIKNITDTLYENYKEIEKYSINNNEKYISSLVMNYIGDLSNIELYPKNKIKDKNYKYRGKVIFLIKIII